MVAAALMLATPFFIVFGALSDKIGRKKIVLAAALLAALTYFPIFKALTHFANPASSMRRDEPGHGRRRPTRMHFQFDPDRQGKFTTSCDVAKAAREEGVPYKNEAAPGRTSRPCRSASDRRRDFDGARSPPPSSRRSRPRSPAMAEAVKAAGYPAKADMSKVNYPMVSSCSASSRST